MMVLLGLYLGLMAKKELAKHSAVIEFSATEYIFNKKGHKKRTLVLKDIRELLSNGRLNPDDSMIVKKTGKVRTVKEIFSSGIISQYSGLIKSPLKGQSVKLFLILYGLTFGFYFYFWFLRNYRNFRNYKHIKINPELLTIVLFSTAVIPYFVYGVVLEGSGLSRFSLLVEVSFNLLIAVIPAVFLFIQLRILKRFLKRKMKGTFNVELIVFGFLLFNGLAKVWSLNMPFYWFGIIVFTVCEGIVLAFVQKDLNAYWKLEGERVG
jgi:hypothetical protein